MKRILITAVLLLAGCQSQTDPNLQWLLAVTNGGASPTSTPETVPFTINVGDQTGSSDFLFQNTSTIQASITVVDGVAPVNGSMIQILQLNSGTNKVIFRAVTDAAGNVTGSFTIENRANPSVTIQFTYAGQTYAFDVDITNVKQINRVIYVSAFIKQIPVIVDRDGDGIPDNLDDYPDDATRATRISIPSDSYYTIAYEDLYPVPGDADFNDFVVRIRSEEDLNAAGKVVRIRSEFTHVAKGAGYNHILRMKLPADGPYTLKRTAADGTVVLDTTGTLVANTGFDVFPVSNTTISQSNTGAGQTFQMGMKVDFEVVLTTPIDTTALTFPYDIYLYVINSKKEIHFAGRVFDATGKDLYLDKDGFPWALMIPGDWAWPLECKNIHNAYPQFKTWYSSAGQQSVDWYKTADSTYVFLK